MDEFQTLTPDRETFLRVWKRVMPDDSRSPIAIAPPEPVRPQHPQQPMQRPKSPPEEKREAPRLPDLLKALDEGLAGAGEITRRVPGAYPLGESLRASANQVRSAYFLQTGQKWRGKPQAGPGREPLEALLRRQYVWEIRWADLCREAGEREKARDIREIFPELEQASRRRRGMIRNLLART